MRKTGQIAFIPGFMTLLTITTLLMVMTQGFSQEEGFRFTPNGTDPTEPRTRLDFQIAQATVLSNGELFGTGFSGDLALTNWFSAGIGVPFIFANLASDEHFGIGDVALRALVAPYQANDNDAVFRAVGIGAEVTFKTGDAEKGTGRGQNVFSPFIAASFEVAEALYFIPLIDNEMSFSEEDETRGVNDLTINLPFIYSFSGGFWIRLNLQGIYDLNGDFQPLYLFNSELGIMVNEKVGFAGILTNHIAGEKRFDVLGSFNMRILL